MTQHKQQIREQLLRRLRRQPQRQRLAKSKAILRALARLEVYRRAKKVLCYAAIAGEVETRPLLERMLAERKRVAVPMARRDGHLVACEIRDVGRDLNHRGLFGVAHPNPALARPVRPDRLDLVILPGVAFDRRCGRLGRGKGYFDRYLARVPKRVPRVGLAFGFQVVRELPQETHDQPVWAVVTEKGIHEGTHRR